MCTLQCWNDPFKLGQLKRCGKGFFICSIQKLCTTAIKQMRMQWPYSRIIQAGRNTVWLYNLTIFCLHHKTFTSMQNTRSAKSGCSCAVTAINTEPRCLYSNQLYRRFVQKMIKCPRCIASATNAGKHMGWQLISCFFFQLTADLLTDDGLKTCYHI